MQARLIFKKEDEMRRAEKIGWARYLEEINSRPSLLTEAAPLAPGERPPGKTITRGDPGR